MVIHLDGVVLVQMNSAYVLISIALHRIPDDLKIIMSGKN